MADQIPDSAKLLPCPFCGAPEERLVQAYTRVTDDFAFWSVECQMCGAEIADDEGQAKADAAWNTRAAPPAMDREAVDAGGYVLVPAIATRAMVDAADACADAYSAYAAMVEVARVR